MGARGEGQGASTAQTPSWRGPGHGSPRYDNQCSSSPDKGGSLEEPRSHLIKACSLCLRRPQTGPRLAPRAQGRGKLQPQLGGGRLALAALWDFTSSQGGAGKGRGHRGARAKNRKWGHFIQELPRICLRDNQFKTLSST